MRSFAAFGVSLLLVSIPAVAQRRSGSPAPSPITIHQAAPPIAVRSGGALGGSFASIGISRPLGGIAPSNAVLPQKRRNERLGYRYVGPVYYVPNAFDSFYPSYSYSTFDTPANPALYYTPTIAPQGQPQQPVIINQYFGSRTTSTSSEDGVTSTATAESKPGDPIGTPQNYYLIAYKNHSVYSALAYWVEGDTLHYVTTQNTHNQASLALIDLDQTTKLNAGNSVPFALK